MKLGSHLQRIGAGVLAAATAATFVVVGVSSAAGASSARASHKHAAAVKTIRLVYDWPGMDFEAVPITAGNAMGFYKKAGLKVQIVIPPSTSTTVKMIAAQKGTIGFDTTVDVVFAQAAGINVKSIANYSQHNDWGLVAAPGKTINMKQLKGKSIGIFTDAWTKSMMPYVLRAGKVSASDITQPIFTTTDIKPLLAGKIDIATNTLNYAKAQVQAATGKMPTVKLATSFGAPNVPIWVYTATTAWLKGHGPEAKAFISATKKAMAWSIAHPQAAMKTFFKAYPRLVPTKKYETFGWLATIPALGKTNALLTQRASQWTIVAKALKSSKLVTSVKPASAYFTSRYSGS